ncbi:heterokaryon incompatibility protein-domain-containing protein [Chaetomium fimeti]|uniref:Heterokaryon incompatibility protein-domain-containing protein n=1 Tax=Chaetomium fimeti TaxID=1854472 RepID=A0AAE0H8G9_9PEZI|nr:heterokaryon incompatibility protein-domain-containing protein [Chaetomium fimeti]
MRLLNTETLEVEDGFFEKNTPPYAILSHTWGNEEVILQDLDDRLAAMRKAGYRKVEGTCRLALKEGFRYVWIDTCCIDKLSSAELSEAINSMFRWYQTAAACYVYLSDVDSGLADDNFPSQFRKSKWFTRGWTLQELIAPRQLTFHASDWSYLSHRAGLSHSISDITGINQKFLDGSRQAEGRIQSLLAQASVAERMSWASARQTTRVEDIAYSLLGIFGVNMPLLYGEGENAFLRLQHTIAGQSSDQTLFAWRREHPDPDNRISGIFAASPNAFANSADLVPFDDGGNIAPFSITNHGLHITIPIRNGTALLQCRHRDDITTIRTIALRQLRGKVYARVDTDLLGSISYKAWEWWWNKTVYVIAVGSIPERPEDGFVIRRLPDGFDSSGFCVGRMIPFRNRLSWELGDGETFEDAIILKQRGFEAHLTLCAWRESRPALDGRDRKTLASYYFTTKTRTVPKSVKNTGVGERLSAVAYHPKGMLYADITQQKALGQTICFVDIILTTTLVSTARVRLSTAINRGYHRASVWAAGVMSMAFSVSPVVVADRMTTVHDSLLKTLTNLWIPWAIFSVLFWSILRLSLLINPDNNAYISLPMRIPFDQRRIGLTVMYQFPLLALRVWYVYIQDAYQPFYSRTLGVKVSKTPMLLAFIFPLKEWIHLCIVFSFSFLLQAFIPLWVLGSPLIIISGGLLSFIILLFPFLWVMSLMESFMRHSIIARDLTGGTIVASKLENSRSKYRH